MDLATQVKEKLAELQQALEDKTPGLVGILRPIHQHLKKDPEIVTLLTEEECAILTNGLKQHTSIVITTTAKKPKTKPGSQMTLADL